MMTRETGKAGNCNLIRSDAHDINMNDERISNVGQKGYIDKLFIIIILYGILYKIIFLLLFPDRTEDAFLYVLSSEGALRSGFRGASLFGRSEHFLYVLFLYITTSIFRNGMVAGKALSVFFSTLTIIITYRIGVRHFTRKCALYTAILLSFIGLGHLLHTTAVLSEPMFMFSAVLSFMIYLDTRWISASDKLARFAAGGLLGITMAISFWVRVETGLLCLCYFLFYLVSKRWREMTTFLLIAAPSTVLRYLAIPEATMTSVTDILGARFGANYGWREFFSILWNNTGMLLWHFAGDSILLTIVFILILGAGLVLFIRNYKLSQMRKRLNDGAQTRPGFPDSPILPLPNSPALAALTLIIINLLGISSMKYYRMHPSVYRHFTYLAPFLALLLGLALERIEFALSRLPENLFGEQVGARIKRRCGLRYVGHILRAVVAIATLLLAALSVPGQLTLSYKNGFLWRHIHFQDPHKAVGKWIRKNLQPNDAVIFSLPTDIYYSRPLSETNQVLSWPQNRYDYQYYKKNKIRYVVWSDIQTDMNNIGTLGLERDFLFFRHRYSPPQPLINLNDLSEQPVFSGWRSVIYEIVPVQEEKLFPAIDYGMGFTIPQQRDNSESGRQFYATGNLNIITDHPCLVKTSFVIDPPRSGRLRICQHGITIHEVRLSASRSRRVTFLAMSEGAGVTFLDVEYQPAVHAQIRHLRIEDVPTSSTSGHERTLNVVFGDGWLVQESWGRWMSDRAIIEIDLTCPSTSIPVHDSAVYVLLSTQVKSYRVERDLITSINDGQRAIYQIPSDADFDKNVMQIEQVLQLRSGMNRIELIASPGADASNSEAETGRLLTIAFHDFRIVRIK